MMKRRHLGLTMLELAFILVIMGILASTLVPAIHSLHHKSMEETDRKALRVLKEAIVGQFLAAGALPACKDGSGNPINGNCDTQQSLGHLPVALHDARNLAFKYDVWNEAASDLTASDKTTACARLDHAISNPVANQPSICAGVPDYDAPNTPYCAPPQNIAFVLVATGNNRPGRGGESATGLWMNNTCPPNRNIGTDRVFERPARRANANCYYDDIVEVVTLQELKARCPL